MVTLAYSGTQDTTIARYYTIYRFMKRRAWGLTVQKDNHRITSISWKTSKLIYDILIRRVPVFSIGRITACYPEAMKTPYPHIKNKTSRGLAASILSRYLFSLMKLSTLLSFFIVLLPVFYSDKVSYILVISIGSRNPYHQSALQHRRIILLLV